MKSFIDLRELFIDWFGRAEETKTKLAELEQSAERLMATHRQFLTDLTLFSQNLVAIKALIEAAKEAGDPEVQRLAREAEEAVRVIGVLRKEREE